VELMISITILILLFIVCLFFSAIFSSSEVAIISITRAKVRLLLQAKEKRAEHLAALKKKPDHTLITILIGNNIVNVAAASVPGPANGTVHPRTFPLVLPVSLAV
jgi:putative hemolysin